MVEVVSVNAAASKRHFLAPGFAGSCCPVTLTVLPGEGIRTVGQRSACRVAVANVNENTLHEYHSYLANSGSLGRLATQVTEEVFFLLFMNRALLRRLHEEIAQRIRDTDSTILAAEEAALFKINRPNRFCLSLHDPWLDGSFLNLSVRYNS